ncbi:MAG: hypothetical protein Kow00127_11950 [Bacteroidales bacterium]
MKKLSTLLILLTFALGVSAQQRALPGKSLRDLSLPDKAPVADLQPLQISGTIGAKAASMLVPVETIVGITRYDDQSNASIQNRIYYYPDGTIGATWIYGMNDGSGFDDRGTGYVYYDGSNWSPLPNGIVEDERTGWPSYVPLGENGELVVSHTGGDGYKLSMRPEKGTGDWSYSLLPGPPGHEYVIWNRTMTSGPDRNRIHVLSLTASTAYGGTPYEGLDGALLYSLSTDGGQTWEIQNAILDGMTSDEYFGFSSDTYDWAEPRDSIIAFLVGDAWYDMFLMKSTDYGETFEKTVIWEHPYPAYDFTYGTDTFYCPDGSHHLVIDASGKVHVVFGINRSYADDAGSTYWFPYVDGVGYWNEDMPPFSPDLNALSPYGDPGSELIEDYNLIGWSQDIDGDGELTFLDNPPYYLGLSSQVQIVLGMNGELYVTYSSLTETYTNMTYNYRHLWSRVSPDGGITWGYFYDLNSDFIHQYDECVYASCAANSDDNIYLVYQQDTEPGNAVWGQTHPYTDNNIVVMQIDKNEITGIGETTVPLTEQDLFQNEPNPASDYTEVPVNMLKGGQVDFSVYDITGKAWYQTSQSVNPGLNRFGFDVSDWPAGIYFYSIQAGDVRVTKKMMVL